MDQLGRVFELSDVLDGQHAGAGVAYSLHGIPLLPTPLFSKLFVLVIDLGCSFCSVFSGDDAFHGGLRSVLASEWHLIAYDGL